MPACSGDDFVLTDNGRAQRIESASLEAMPLSVLLVLDTSGSMAGTRFGNLIAGAKDVLKTLGPEDRVALMTFSSHVSQEVELTGDIARVEQALDELTPHGGTSLRDAVYAALKVTPAPGSRGVALVFSDGVDTLSWLTAPANPDRRQSRRPRHLRCGAYGFSSKQHHSLDRSNPGADHRRHWRPPLGHRSIRTHRTAPPRSARRHALALPPDLLSRTARDTRLARAESDSEDRPRRHPHPPGLSGSVAPGCSSEAPAPSAKVPYLLTSSISM